jgi:calcium-dependent protein kinase
LKLENFLFEDKGTTSPLKLIDFGLSKHFAEHEQMRQVVVESIFRKLFQVVGSAYYTAPEVLRGAYDQRCDVWSIGVIGYMLLSGCPPFYGSNSDAIHDMILTEEADFTSKRFSHVSSLALDFLQKVKPD